MAHENSNVPPEEFQFQRQELTPTAAVSLATIQDLISSPENPENIFNPFNAEQKCSLLSPEALSRLSMAEYIALWQKLNPYYLSHITRQGFRDHVGMIDHTEGLEVFHSGLTDALRDDLLIRPPIVVRNFRVGDEESLTAWLEKSVLQSPTAEEAHQYVDGFLVSGRLYPDKTAVHFAAQEVASTYYGGETGNEVFFVFPSDVIASQYPFAFSTEDKSFISNKLVGNVWNDVFVWPPLKDQAIPIDAGIVFLPKDMLVDPLTGSRYASELKVIEGQESRVVAKDETLIETFEEWASSTDVSALTAAFYSGRDFSEATLLIRARQELNAWFPSDTVDALIQLLAEKVHWGIMGERSLRAIAKKARADWKQPENSIPAQVYWEEYFQTHPARQPKHIAYYQGDPSQAVSTFLRQHNIGYVDTSAAEGSLLGFDRNHIARMQDDPRANHGYAEMVAQAHRIIDVHYRVSASSNSVRAGVLHALQKFLRWRP